MIKQKTLVSAIAVVLAAVALGALINHYVLSGTIEEKKPFYVGVTFCGDNTQEAKLLIDKVKGYTNLFVLQSGSLMTNETAVTEIGDYAVSNGLHFAAYFAQSNHPKDASWIGIAWQRWGDMFAGIYYGDESGGEMLDSNLILSQNTTNQTIGNTTVTAVSGNIIKIAGGQIISGDTTYYPDGTVRVSNIASSTVTFYYPNGTIILQEAWGNVFTTENGTNRISQAESYEEVLSRHPIPNRDVAAEIFVNRTKEKLNQLSDHWQLENRLFPLFTADYALYWWDYQSGYDMILAELGWNNTVAQEIGLVRGAANVQGKRWGTIITWTYTKPPYLIGGNEMYEQMRMSYECGAEQIVIFNFAQDMEGPYGILQPEHFETLEKFWNDVVQNPDVIHGNVKAEAVLVLPENYGWGMRNPSDIIWGLWDADSLSEQIWMQLQSRRAQFTLRLDIVYEDPLHPVSGRYSKIYYWNQTG